MVQVVDRDRTALSVLERRIQSVPPAALPLLQLGAVLGSDIEHAAAALHRPAAEFAAMRSELESHGVLREGRFVHDLMRETALASLDAPERRHWHGVAAAVLAPEARVPRARVAAHWERAEQWGDAGAAYRAAGLHADETGNPVEARQLFTQACACFRRADDRAGEFAALCDSVHAELYLRDIGPAQALVERLSALASTDEERARVAVVAARVAVSCYVRGDAALAPTADAVGLAAPFPALHREALSLHSAALAQAGQHDEAIAVGLQALAMAEAADASSLAREIASNLAYVYYEASRFAEAIAVSRDVIAAFDIAGDPASAGAVEGNLATLLLLTGDPASAVLPGLRAYARYRETEPSATSPLAIMNRAAMASALAYLGRFGESLEMLSEAGTPIADWAQGGLRAKAQLVLAHVWLLLGNAEGALAALDPNDADWPPSMQIQRCWVLARVAHLRQQSATDFLKRIARIHAQHAQVPLAHMPWLEWSRQGEAREVAEQMLRVQALYEKAGMPGVARAAALRRIDRLAELTDAASADAAGAAALELLPRLHEGLHAATYLPEAWLVLAKALSRIDRHQAASDARSAALQWIEDTALPHVPDAWRESFLERNPVNRALRRAAW